MRILLPLVFLMFTSSTFASNKLGVFGGYSTIRLNPENDNLNNNVSGGLEFSSELSAHFDAGLRYQLYADRGELVQNNDLIYLNFLMVFAGYRFSAPLESTFFTNVYLGIMEAHSNGLGATRTVLGAGSGYTHFISQQFSISGELSFLAALGPVDSLFVTTPALKMNYLF